MVSDDGSSAIGIGALDPSSVGDTDDVDVSPTGSKVGCKGRAKQCLDAAAGVGSTKAGFSCETNPVASRKQPTGGLTALTGEMGAGCMSEEGYELEPQLDVPNEITADTSDRLLEEDGSKGGTIDQCRVWDEATASWTLEGVTT